MEEQRLSKVDTITFDSFEKYYDFLEGDIYQDACYYQYSFSNEILRQFKLDGNKLKEKVGSLDIHRKVAELINDEHPVLGENL